MTTNIELPVFPSHPSCTDCELHQGALNPGVPTIHYKESLFPSAENPALVVVGMNPGVQEDKANKPFVGPTGRMLKDVYLLVLEVKDTHTIYFTNAARCCTPGNTALKNSHLKACWRHTGTDLNRITKWHTNKISLLCLGSHAVSTISKNVMGKNHSLKEALEKQGSTHSYNNREVSFFCTYHPAGVMRQPNLKFAVSEHLAIIGQQLKGEVPSASLPTIIPMRSPQ